MKNTQDGAMTLQTDSNAIRLPEQGTDEMSCQRFKFLQADLMRGIVMQQILHVSTFCASIRRKNRLWYSTVGNCIVDRNIELTNISDERMANMQKNNKATHDRPSK